MTSYYKLSLEDYEEFPPGASVNIEVDWYLENDSIGGYEYCGRKGIDRRESYPVIDRTSWNGGAYTPEQNDIIEQVIANNLNNIALALLK